jgi:hypothetical protein
MEKTDFTALVTFPIVVLIGLAVAWAGSQGGASVLGIPVFALSVGLAFIPAYLLQNERFFDPDLSRGLSKQSEIDRDHQPLDGVCVT